MTGPTWSYRALDRGYYEITVDGAPAATVLFPNGKVSHPALVMRQFAALLARVEHGHLDLPPQPAESTDPATANPQAVNWRKLGWRNRRQHDEHLAKIRAISAAWSTSPLCGRLDHQVRSEATAAGIPDKGPYTATQLAQLERIIRRAPHIVEQDVAAERGAA